jgi:hypothetical protein
MSIRCATHSPNLGTTAMFQSPSSSLKVHGNLKKEALRLAEKTNSYVSPLLVSIGAALLVGGLFSFSAAILTGFILYFALSWFSSSTHRHGNHGYYPPSRPTVPFHPHSPGHVQIGGGGRSGPSFHPRGSHAIPGSGGKRGVSPPRSPNTRWSGFRTPPSSHHDGSRSELGRRRTGRNPSPRSFGPPPARGRFHPQGPNNPTGEQRGSYADPGGRRTSW